MFFSMTRSRYDARIIRIFVLKKNSFTLANYDTSWAGIEEIQCLGENGGYSDYTNGLDSE
jgi:hypothetical protein